MRRSDPRATTQRAPRPGFLRSVTPAELPKPLSKRFLFDRNSASAASGPEGDDQMIAHLGGPESVPRVIAAPIEIRTLSIDPRLAFLLSRIDGDLTVESLMDLGVLPPEEVVFGLWTLVSLGVVAVSR